MIIQSYIQLQDFLRKNEKYVLLYVTLLTVVLRTICVIIVYEKLGTSYWVDAFYYIEGAERISQGDWILSFNDKSYFIVGPSLSILGAGFIMLFGNLIIPFFIYNILATSLMVPVLYYLGKEVFNDTAGWWMAVWGVFFYEAFKYCPQVLKEPTLFLFLPLILLLLVRSTKSISPVKNVILAALAFTWLIHTDERFFVYFPFFILIFLLAKQFSLIQFLKLAGLWLSIILVLMVPWEIRNYIVFKQVVILTPRTTAITYRLWGKNFAGSASHFSDEAVRQKNIENRREQAEIFGKEYGITPREYNNCEARARAFKNFWQPAYFRPEFIQFGFRPQKWSFSHNILGIIFYGIFLPFYLMGIILPIKQKYFIGLFLASIPMIHSLIHAYMIWPLERYRSSIDFIIVMIAFWSADFLIKIIRKNYKSDIEINN